MSTSEMKLCPYCGEEIRAIAIRCRHCQMMLDGSGQAVSGAVPGGATGSTGEGATEEDGTGAYPGGGTVRLKPGCVLGSGRYELKELLGKGGMGEVFLAEHRYTCQKVALKAVWPGLMDSEGLRKRFLQEGRVLAQLRHPNIVGLTDFFEEDGLFFLVMEYVEGQTLAAYLKAILETGGRVAVGEAKRILEGVLKGLSHAHAQIPYVVHRDVKPANVMLAKDGRVVLMDFGIAKVAQGEKITRTAGVVGTYEYMSPEQVSGRGITPATDVYAVGIMAYELLTGDVPFPQRDDSGFDAMEGHKNRRPPPVQGSRRDCPLELSGWVDRALAKSPEARYQSAAAMLAALERGGEPAPSGAFDEGRGWMGGTAPGEVPVGAAKAGMATKTGGTWRGWAIGGLLAACMIAALVYLLPGPNRETPASGDYSATPGLNATKPALPSASADDAAASRTREREEQAMAAAEASTKERRRREEAAAEERRRQEEAAEQEAEAAEAAQLEREEAARREAAAQAAEKAKRKATRLNDLQAKLSQAQADYQRTFRRFEEATAMLAANPMADMSTWMNAQNEMNKAIEVKSKLEVEMMYLRLE